MSWNRLTLCPVPVPVDVEYPDSTLVTHALLGDADNLVVVFAERDPLDGRWELPEEQTLARRYGPETHGVVGGAADEEA